MNAEQVGLMVGSGLIASIICVPCYVLFSFCWGGRNDVVTVYRRSLPAMSHPEGKTYTSPKDQLVVFGEQGNILGVYPLIGVKLVTSDNTNPKEFHYGSDNK